MSEAKGAPWFCGARGKFKKPTMIYDDDVFLERCKMPDSYVLLWSSLMSCPVLPLMQLIKHQIDPKCSTMLSSVYQLVSDRQKNMNYSRVLRATNILLILTGYQLHWFDRKSRRFEISLIAVVNVFVLGCLYAACFAQHFRPSSMLKVLHDVSPLLYGLTRVQLMLGLKVFAYAIYSSARAVVGINSLIESFPADGRALNKAESIAYGFLGSTLSVLFGFGVYIAYKMDFKLPLLQEAMIGMALFLPHLALGGSVRLYCILAWLSCVRLKQLKREVVEEFSTNLKRDEADSASTSFSISQPPVTRSNSDGLELKRRQLESLRNRFNFFFRDMQFSLLFLCTINANCLLSGAYSYVNFTNSWHLLFEERKQRIFYAANASIYACIGCDYMCLLLAQVLMEKERLGFMQKLESVLAQRSSLPKSIHSLAKGMKEILLNTFQTKFFSLWPFKVTNFVLLLLLQCLTIALVIVFHYLNDEIIQLKEQLESMNDE